MPRLRAEAAATFTELATGSNDGEPYTLPDPANGGADGGASAGVSALLLVPACEVLGPLFFGPRLSALDASAKTAHEFFAVAQALLKAGGKWNSDPGKVSVVSVCVCVGCVCCVEESERERERKRQRFDDKGQTTNHLTTLPSSSIGSPLARGQASLHRLSEGGPFRRL